MAVKSIIFRCNFVSVYPCLTIYVLIFSIPNRWINIFVAVLSLTVIINFANSSMVKAVPTEYPDNIPAPPT